MSLPLYHTVHSLSLLLLRYPLVSGPFSVVTGIKATSRLHGCRAILYALMSAHVVACMPAWPSGTREFYPTCLRPDRTGKPVRNVYPVGSVALGRLKKFDGTNMYIYRFTIRRPYLLFVNGNLGSI